MDCTVRSWIYGTISNDLMETILKPRASARVIWLPVESQFLDNQEQRAILLDTEFRTFVQGDLSISDYCCRLKTMADALRGFGEDIPDRTLVLNVIRGLNEKFAPIGIHLLRAKPFPTFLEARTELLLEELTMGKPASDSSTALLASAPGGSGPTSSHGSTGAHNGNGEHPQHPPRTNKSGGAGGGAPKQRHSGGNDGNRGNKRNGSQRSKNGGSSSNGGRGGCSNSSSTGGSSGIPPGLVITWPGLQLWPGASTGQAQQHQALLAQYQATQQQAAHAAQAQAQAYAQAQALHLQAQPPGSSPATGQWPAGVPGIYSNPGGAPYWDPQSLASTFSTMTLNQPQQNEWHFDSGATSHMASDSTILSHVFTQRYPVPSNIVVGDGSLLPVTSTGFAHLPYNLSLNNVLVSPKLIKNLIYVF
jgi:hypothetical protein